MTKGNKKRIFIFGGDGMLGHILLKNLEKKHDVKVTLRNNILFYDKYNIFNINNSIDEFDPLNSHNLDEILCEYRPDIVINALGLIKQRSEAANYILSLEINSLFPHRLALACKRINARFIQLSTDCVFSGKKGSYIETDLPDACELYGRTKLLGECYYENVLTLRTSFFGLELRHKTGLIEWFLAQSGEIRGYTKAIYSGILTSEMGKVIEDIITKYPEMSGLWHVSSEPIDKYGLLVKLSDIMGRNDIKIKPDNSFCCDRSLNAQKFKEYTGYQPPSWNSMLSTLAEQITEG